MFSNKLACPFRTSSSTCDAPHTNIISKWFSLCLKGTGNGDLRTKHLEPAHRKFGGFLTEVQSLVPRKNADGALGELRPDQRETEECIPEEIGNECTAEAIERTASHPPRHSVKFEEDCATTPVFQKQLSSYQRIYQIAKM
mmetsp:Transcript_2779/g.5223  ORF Transcript_2779/g.5223 Transcript_2779/m.5223 type:complete len:141 (-) Transcript_2779:254-676(-)